MLIVVEGIDGAGKSTLIRALVDALTGQGSVQVISSGPLVDHPLVEYEARLLSYHPDNGHHIICDRWHVGELVYGPLYRGLSKLTPAMNRHVELFLRSRGALRVVMDTPLHIVRKRLWDRGDDLLHPTHVEQVWRFYRFHCAAERYSFVDTVTSETVPKMINAARRRADAVKDLSAEWPTYVGPTQPELLLLGERRNNANFPSAFVPFGGTSGEFLLDRLEAIQATNYGLANALEEINLRALWRALGKPRVVAMGQSALRVVRDNHIPYHHVPHPQWVRRFAHHRGIEYAERIAYGTPGRSDDSRRRVRETSVASSDAG